MSSNFSVDFLNTNGAQPLARWLIEAALARDTFTYGEAKSRLQHILEIEGEIFPTRIGGPAGRLMQDIHAIDQSAPLLNVILVRQADGLPGEGAGSFMARHLSKPILSTKGIRSKKPKLWRKSFERAATEVYAYPHWEELFLRAYGKRFSRADQSAYSIETASSEKGLGFGNGGEGTKHKKLRRWALENPTGVCKWAAPCRAETEVVLKSADRVDVVYYGADHTTAVEVKSISSNDLDLERGVFQCVKYRSVMQAMDPRRNSNIRSVLVTERKLPSHLAELAKRLGVAHKQVAVNV